MTSSPAIAVDEATLRRATLPNGLSIVAELHPAMKSTAIGFYVRAGSRDESDALWGVSHFLEHMAFKGRGELDGDELNRRFDDIGAHYNASTSEEVTTYYAAVLPEYLPEAMKLLATLLRPDLRPDDFETEKQVIIEEIGMYDDAPGFLAYENLMATHFAAHPLGRSILGTPESIRDLSRDAMAAYHGDRYGASAVTLAVTGQADWDAIQDLAARHCGDWQPGRADRDVPPPQPVRRANTMHRPEMLIQTIAQGADAPSAQSRERLAAELLSLVVGDDSGSRMYWDLVDTGFAETAELSFNEYDGAGLWMTYLSCLPERAAELADRVAGLYDAVNRDGILQDELDRARNKLSSRMVLQAERPMGRLGAVGAGWVYRGQLQSLDDELAELAAITPDDIAAMLARYPLGQMSTAMVGPLEALDH